MSDIPPCLPDSAPSPDVIYSNLVGPVVQVDGACFSRPQFLTTITDEDDQFVVTSGTNIIDCATVECGPVGLYCYLSLDEPQTGIIVFQPLHFPSPVVVLADNVSRCYGTPAFIQQVFEDYGTVSSSGTDVLARYVIPVATALCGVAYLYESCNGNDELIVVNGGDDSIFYGGQCWHNPQAIAHHGTDTPVIAGTDTLTVASCFATICNGTDPEGPSVVYTDQQSGAEVVVRFEVPSIPHFGIAPESIDDGTNGLTDGSTGINFVNGATRQTIMRVPAPGRLEMLVSLLGHKKRLLLTSAGVTTTYRLPASKNTLFLDVLAGDTIEIEIDDHRPNPSRRSDARVNGFAYWKSSPLSLRLYDTAVYDYDGTTAIQSVAFTGVGDRIPAALYSVPSTASTPYPNPDTYLTVQGEGSSEFVIINSHAPGDQVPTGPADTELYTGQLLVGPLTFRFYTGRGGAGAHGEMDVYLDTDGEFPERLSAGPYRALVRQEPLVRRGEQTGDVLRETLAVAQAGVDYVLPSVYVSEEGKKVVVSGMPQDTFTQNGTEYAFVGTAYGLAYEIQPAPPPPPTPEPPIDPSPNDGYEAFEDVGVPTLTFEDSLALIGFDIEDTTTLESVSFPNLVSCDPLNTQQGLMYFGANAALESLDFPALTISSRFFVVSNPLITSVNLPLFVNVSDPTTNFRIDGNSSLVSLSLPSFVPTLNMVYNFTNNALDAASVNGLLARFVASAGFVAGVIHLEGGGNVAPTGQGVADVATLSGRGVSVSTT